jgi:hypothetical protein
MISILLFGHHWWPPRCHSTRCIRYSLADLWAWTEVESLEPSPHWLQVTLPSL